MKWVLFWVLVVQGPNDNSITDERVVGSQYYDTETECVIELREQQKYLETLLGKDRYITRGYNSGVRVGGVIIEVRTGCKEDDRRKNLKMIDIPPTF